MEKIYDKYKRGLIIRLMCIVIMLSALLTGCKETSDEKQYLSLDDYIKVTTTIDHLRMLNVPGLPIEIETLKENTSYRMKINVENGEFLSWENEMLSSIGKNNDQEYTDSILYWSPLTENIDKRTRLSIQLLNEEKVIARGEYQIVKTDDGYVLLHLVLTNDE